MSVDFIGERCETCTFFHREDDGTLGVCRRYPPQLVMIGVKPDGNGGVEDWLSGQRFPQMLPSGWCGEWTAAGDK